MAKMILWEHPDGSVWSVPAEVVAKHRAQYYAANDPDTTFQEEYEYTISDNFELIDWVQNNMDVDDVEEHTKLVKPPRPSTFETAFLDGEISVSK